MDDQTVVAGTDLFPSVCAIAGVGLPKNVALDGEDLSAALLGLPRRDPRRYSGSMGADVQRVCLSRRAGIAALTWLCVKATGNCSSTRTARTRQPYDLKADPEKETHNVAEKNPEVAGRLKEKALAWRNSLPN